jgi:hypothetical protein
MTNGRTDPDRELAEAKVAEAAEARRRHRRERELLIEESTFRAVLTGLVDSRHSVVVVTAGGRRTAGVLVEVGLDVVVMETAAGLIAAIRIASVLAIEAANVGVGSSESQRDLTRLRTFADVIADVGGTGETITLQLATGVHLDGEMLGVGQDVVIVRAGGSQTIYVALDSLNELAWSTSVG